MKRRCLAVLVGTAGGYGYSKATQCYAYTDGAGLSIGGAQRQLLVETPRVVKTPTGLKGAIHVVRVILRVGYLFYYMFVPLLWAAVLNAVSKRMVSNHTLYAMTLHMLRSSGPCFLKLGQWSATRPDIFGREFCEMVGDLHINAPTHSWEKTRERIRESFGSDEMFEYIDEKPLHSGCIAQVHKARLKGSEKELVVKVMHPDVEESINIDLSIIGCGARAVAALLPGSNWLSLVESCDEFTDLMRSQLDFTLEASNLQRFIRSFENVANVSFPTPLTDYVSQTVLTETFEEGCSLMEYQDEETSVADKQKIAQIGCHAFFKMVFNDNLFHADLHPGNILVNNKDGAFSLTFLDAGLVSKLTKTDQKNFTELFAAVCSGQGGLAAELILKGAKINRCVDPEAFKSGMSEIINKVNAGLRKSFCLRDVHIGEILFETMDVIRNNQVKLDPAFTTLVLSISLIEGMGRSLWPDLNLFRVSVPYILPHVEVSDVNFLGPIITNLYA